MRTTRISSRLTLAFLLAMPALAQAHHAEFMQDRPLLQGLSMPIHGLDHMMVTFAVGLIAAQLGGRALWALPLSFTAAILGGGILNICGIPVPLVEWGILASIVVFGGVLAWGKRLSLLLTGAVIALFAAFHGNALISMDGLVGNLPWFVTGCLLMAGLLQGLGLAAGSALKRFGSIPVFRYAGLAMLVGALVVGLFPQANDFMIQILEGSSH